MKTVKFIAQQPVNMISITMTEEEAKELEEWIDGVGAYSAETRVIKDGLLGALAEGLKEEEPRPDVSEI